MENRCRKIPLPDPECDLEWVPWGPKKLENEWFGGPKMAPKINIFEISGHFFVMLFSNTFFDGFVIDFGRLQTLKIELPPRREQDFHKIDVFKT